MKITLECTEGELAELIWQIQQAPVVTKKLVDDVATELATELGEDFDLRNRTFRA